jgi:hypothetical protein
MRASRSDRLPTFERRSAVVKGLAVASEIGDFPAGVAKVLRELLIGLKSAYRLNQTLNVARIRTKKMGRFSSKERLDSRISVSVIVAAIVLISSELVCVLLPLDSFSTSWNVVSR